MSRAEHFERQGVVIVEHALTSADLARMDEAFAAPLPLPSQPTGSVDLAARPGCRLTGGPCDLVGWLGGHPALAKLVAELVDHPAPRLVRLIAFDKSPAANWFVPWHQDRTIAVERRAAVAGYGRWTLKDGAVHVEPPVDVLRQMVTLRIHLDDCDEDNGPLECLIGSHRHGRLDRAGINEAVATCEARVCLAVRGDILAMRPLTVHRSQRARLPARRRVLHLEYAGCALPAPLRWALGSVLPNVAS